MADDWKVGDLALLFIGGEIDCPHDETVIHTGALCPSVGSVREVVSVELDVLTEGPLASFPCGCVALTFSDASSSLAIRCRKITPEEADDFDLDTIELMNRKTVGETV